MKKLNSSILVFCFISIQHHCFSKNKFEEFLEKTRNKTEQVLGDDWFINSTDKGFEVYFCRSCNEKYINWCENDRLIDSESHDTPIELKDRYNFFRPDLADSVSYFSTVNLVHPYGIREQNKRKYLLDRYEKNGILKFEIWFEKKWKQEKYDFVKNRNDSLKAEVIASGLTKLNDDMFSDYRFWIPDTSWKSRTKKYNYYFQRLPYASVISEYSIFIVPDKPFFFCEVLYVNPNQEEYYKVYSNHIEDERCRALKTIALVLGIHDFRLIN